MTHDCTNTMSGLTRYLNDSTPLDEAQLAHLAVCPQCQAALDRANSLSAMLAEGEPTPPVAAHAAPTPPGVAEEVARSVRRRRLIRIGLAIAIAAIGIATSGWLRIADYTPKHPVAIWVMLMILFGGPLLVAAMAVGADAGPGRFHKRMRNRQLSGVCQGLAEASSIPVWIIRMAFVALIFFNGIGIAAYLILDVVLTIHPDDREQLLRFRIARWWRSRRVSAA